MPSRWLSLITCLALLPAASSVCTGSLYSDLVIDNTSPVIYWNLDETSGPSAADLVGGDNPGTYYGALSQGNAGPRPGEGFGNMDPGNRAPAWTGNTQAVEYTELYTTAGVDRTAYSAQVWFNSSSAFLSKALSYVLGRGNGYSAGEDLRDQVFVGGNYHTVLPNKLGFLNGRSSDGGFHLYGTRTLQKDTWYHLVLVRDDSQTENIKIYLNGELEIHGTAPWLDISSNPAGVGDYLSTGNRSDFHATDWLGLEGRWDEVAVWDRALSAEEAARLFAFAVPEPTSVAVWALALAGWVLFGRRRKR